jgi:hypothetical protein
LKMRRKSENARIRLVNSSTYRKSNGEQFFIIIIVTNVARRLFEIFTVKNGLDCRLAMAAKD